MMAQRADARKRDEAISEGQVAAAAPLLLLDDVRRALGEVYSGAETCEASALLDQLESVGLKVVRA